MKESCEKLFKKGKIGYTLLAVFIVLLSVAVPVVVLLVCNRLVINAIFTLVIVDIGTVIACLIYKKSAYYVEIEGDRVLFYTDKGVSEKNTSDCKRMIKTASEFFMFFNDGMIRLCCFRKCREATACITKEIFPNIK